MTKSVRWSDEAIKRAVDNAFKNAKENISRFNLDCDKNNWDERHASLQYYAMALAIASTFEALCSEQYQGNEEVTENLERLRSRVECEAVVRTGYWLRHPKS